ncbi:hypothetical protein Pelo_8828 [Pelomyxa schiedti]|nr:hypothetical protein Pelo_8828 [Pelomyxa schiedti]
MPTIVIVDNSAQLAAPVDTPLHSNNNAGYAAATSTSSYKRRDAIQRGALHLLGLLQSLVPAEHTCLLSCGGESDYGTAAPPASTAATTATSASSESSSHNPLLVEMGTEFGIMKNALFMLPEPDLVDSSMSSDGRSSSVVSLADSLRIAVEHVTRKCTRAERTACQCIVVCGSSLGITEKDPLPILQAAPFPIRVHVVVLGFQDELPFDKLEHLVTVTGGEMHIAYLPHQANLFMHLFTRLVDTHHAPYSGTLVLGHLEAPISLHPNPLSSLFNLIITNNSLPPTFPTILSIIGFILNKTLPSPANISQHVIIPQNESSLCPMLNHCLYLEHVSAVVLLAANWRGLISSMKNPNGKDEDSSILVLSLLPPGATHPTVGPLSCLISVGSIQGATLLSTPPNPHKPAHQPSYALISSMLQPPPSATQISSKNSKVNPSALLPPVYSVEPEALAALEWRLSRCCAVTPDQLPAECEKVKQLAQAMACPGVIQFASKVLMDNFSHAPELARPLINECLRNLDGTDLSS